MNNVASSVVVRTAPTKRDQSMIKTREHQDRHKTKTVRKIKEKSQQTKWPVLKKNKLMRNKGGRVTLGVTKRVKQGSSFFFFFIIIVWLHCWLILHRLLIKNPQYIQSQTETRPIKNASDTETLKKTRTSLQHYNTSCQCSLAQRDCDVFPPQMKNRSPLTRLFHFQRMIKLHYVISSKRARLSAVASPPSKTPACVFSFFMGFINGH